MIVALMPPAGHPDGVGDSPRVRLAQVSLEAARAVAGVVGTDAGPQGLWVTADPAAGLLRGVSVIAQADGRYSVDLCLVAGLVPLMALSEEVKTKVRDRVALAGLAAELGTINVEFAAVLTREEIAEQAAAAREQEARPVMPAPSPVAEPAPASVPEPPPVAPVDQEPRS